MNDGYSYANTNNLIYEMVKAIQPNFIVITGDTVDPKLWKDYKTLYKQAMTYIETSGIPWMWTGGQSVNGLSRDQMLGLDNEINFKNSWSGY